jgi:hypothetical protein
LYILTETENKFHAWPAMLLLCCCDKFNSRRSAGFGTSGMTKNGIHGIAIANRTALICAAAAMTLAACTSTPAEKAAFAARRAAPTPVVMGPTKGGAPTESGLAKSPDGYPSFAAPLTSANVQMSDEEAAGLQRKLTALGAQRKAGAISEAEYQRRVAEYRKLAAEHGTDTLSEISK